MELFYSCIIFAGFSVAYTWDLNEVNYEKRQLVPLPRIGRSNYDSKRQGLIPSPRVGRSSSASLYGQLFRDCALNPMSCNYYTARRTVPMHDLHEAVHAIHNSRNGSIGSDEPDRHSLLDSSYASDDYQELAETMLDSNRDGISERYFRRDARQLIPAPRVGRSVSESESALSRALITGYGSAAKDNTGDDDDSADPIGIQLRAANFIPRLGKRARNTLNIDRQLLTDLNEELKRAAAFTPRIGRAAFVPRIGKKAAFVPRIGRSPLSADPELRAS